MSDYQACQCECKFLIKNRLLIKKSLTYRCGFIQDNYTTTLLNATSQRSSQLYAAKQEKNNLIKVLAKAKLDSISDAKAQGIQDENISPNEFPKIQQEMEKILQATRRDLNTAQSKIERDYKIAKKKSFLNEFLCFL